MFEWLAEGLRRLDFDEACSLGLRMNELDGLQTVIEEHFHIGHAFCMSYVCTPSKMPLSCVCIVSIVLLSLLYVTKIKIVNNNENGNGYTAICLLSGRDSRQDLDDLRSLR